MKMENYFYRCSKEYIDAIETHLYNEIVDVIKLLPKRQTQSEINRDFFWLLTNKGRCFDSKPQNVANTPPVELGITGINLPSLQKVNNRALGLSSTTLNTNWRADFAKLFNDKLVQIEIEFGTVESMFKDFCGFQIACYEHRLALGIEVVLSHPNQYFSHRKNSISGMAYFETAKNTLPAIGLDCPIWLIGMTE